MKSHINDKRYYKMIVSIIIYLIILSGFFRIDVIKSKSIKAKMMRGVRL